MSEAATNVHVSKHPVLYHKVSPNARNYVVVSLHLNHCYRFLFFDRPPQNPANFEVF